MLLEMLIDGIDITRIVGNAFYVILIMIGFDIVTGLLSGAKMRKLNSSISFEGLLKKVAELIALVFATFIDAYLQADGYITKITVGMIVAYEGISIIENFGKLGLDVKFLMKYFDKSKTGKGDK